MFLLTSSNEWFTNGSNKLPPRHEMRKRLSHLSTSCVLDSKLEVPMGQRTHTYVYLLGIIPWHRKYDKSKYKMSSGAMVVFYLQ